MFSEILVCSGGGGGSDCIDMVSKELMWVPDDTLCTPVHPCDCGLWLVVGCDPALVLRVGGQGAVHGLLCLTF